MQYNVTVTFRNGTTRTKDFDDVEKADRYFNRYNNMLPNPRQPTTQVASVRWADSRIVRFFDLHSGVAERR